MGSGEARIINKNRISVVEDEPDIASLISSHLQKEGFAVEHFSTGESFLRSLLKRSPDLVLLDLMLPDMDGIDVCKSLKLNEKWSSLPIIMVTAKGEETDKIVGLELGADDYVIKPFSLKELTARIKAVLRRGAERIQTKKIIIGGMLVIDLERHEVSRAGMPLELTPTEFKILSVLASKKGRVFTRDQILDNLWGNEKIVLDRTVDVHIKNLRQKLGQASRFLKNIRGVGYKIEE
jgi:two-component system phosphate regulon response regulator PhoB/two-component system alkaline phosphatase synthesis response regulator PhoP